MKRNPINCLVCGKPLPVPAFQAVIRCSCGTSHNFNPKARKHKLEVSYLPEALKRNPI